MWPLWAAQVERREALRAVLKASLASALLLAAPAGSAQVPGSDSPAAVEVGSDESGPTPLAGELEIL